MGWRDERKQTGPLRGRGHYDEDGVKWFAESEGRWHWLSRGIDHAEVVLEDLRPRSALGQVFGSLAWQTGLTQVQLVAIATSDDPRWPTYRVIGPVFELPGGWKPVAQGPIERLAVGYLTPFFQEQLERAISQFRAELVAQGWLSAGAGGEQPWSMRLVRPCLSATTLPVEPD